MGGGQESTIWLFFREGQTSSKKDLLCSRFFDSFWQITDEQQTWYRCDISLIFAMIDRNARHGPKYPVCLELFLWGGRSRSCQGLSSWPELCQTTGGNRGRYLLSSLFDSIEGLKRGSFGFHWLSWAFMGCLRDRYCLWLIAASIINFFQELPRAQVRGKRWTFFSCTEGKNKKHRNVCLKTRFRRLNSCRVK